jgi:hypothetical protein
MTECLIMIQLPHLFALMANSLDPSQPQPQPQHDHYQNEITDKTRIDWLDVPCDKVSLNKITFLKSYFPKLRLLACIKHQNTIPRCGIEHMLYSLNFNGVGLKFLH